MFDYRKLEGRQVQISQSIPNISFYIPFLYITLARMGTLAKSFSLILIYVVPTYYYYLLTHGFDFSSTPVYLTCFVLIYTLYEIGYIQNDTETIKFENNPSLRLWPKNFDYYAKHRVAIYTTRLFIAVCLSFILLLLNGFNLGSYLFLLMATMIIVIYQAYNRIRSCWSLPLFALLQIVRYLPYMVLLTPFIDWKATLILFVSHPLCYITERLSHPRFKIPYIEYIIPNTEALTIFRIRYYALFSVLFLVWTVCKGVTWEYGIILFYFLIYRIFIMFVVKHKRPKNYLVR